MNEYTVSLDWDDEAAKWYALNDDIPIALESDSLDTLIKRVKTATPELLELNGKPHSNIHLLFRMEAQAIVAWKYASAMSPMA
ncbi:DUF1902 domain-containing protein [Treponema sp. R80B11-R83G3]